VKRREKCYDNVLINNNAIKCIENISYICDINIANNIVKNGRNYLVE